MKNWVAEHSAMTYFKDKLEQEGTSHSPVSLLSLLSGRHHTDPYTVPRRGMKKLNVPKPGYMQSEAEQRQVSRKRGGILNSNWEQE